MNCSRRKQAVRLPKALDQLKDAGEDQQNPGPAEAANDLDLKIVAGNRELVRAADLHERRNYYHRQQQKKHDLITLVQHLVTSFHSCRVLTNGRFLLRGIYHMRL